jgi:hypothetical protein
MTRASDGGAFVSGTAQSAGRARKPSIFGGLRGIGGQVPKWSRQPMVNPILLGDAKRGERGAN